MYFPRLSVCVLLVLGFPRLSAAQWSTDPAANLSIREDPSHQIVSLATPDGTGGLITLWVQGFEDSDLYAQRVDARGYRQWGPEGVPVAAAPRIQYPEAIVPDGHGGAIVLWMDYRHHPGPIDFDATTNSLWVQRIDSTGQRCWGPEGVPLRTDTAGWYHHPTLGEMLVPDGRGGGYIAWKASYRDSTGEQHYSTFVQYVDPIGQPQWGEGGTILQPEGWSGRVYGIPDGQGGCYINSQGYLYRLQPEGSSTDFVPLHIVEIAPDLSVGFVVPAPRDGVFYVGFTREHSQVTGIRVLRFTATGHLRWSAHIPEAEGAFRCSLQAVPDGTGGVLVSWGDQHSTASWAQRVDSAGTVRWAAPVAYQGNGGESCDPVTGYRSTLIAATGAGGGYVPRTVETDSAYRRVVQRIGPDGVTVWPGGGTTFITRQQEPQSPYGKMRAYCLGDGGVVYVWPELNQTTKYYDVNVQYIGKTGVLGLPDTKLGRPTSPRDSNELKLKVFPNPFNKSVTITFSTESVSPTRISIVSIQGTTVDEWTEFPPGPGFHQTQWTGTTYSGKAVSAGIYYCVVRQGDRMGKRKIVFLK